jgi:spore germination cell wall hydrolase CwlJ-like protein
MNFINSSSIIGLLLCAAFIFNNQFNYNNELDNQISLVTHKKQKKEFVKIIEPPKPINKSIECLAKNIYFEARSEPIYEQIAVGQVTLNRVNDERYSKNICGVVYEPYQFSWTLKKNHYIAEKAAWKKALVIAKDLYYGDITKDYVKGATHFHTKKIKPSWSKNGYDKIALNSHIFMKVD